MNKSKIFSIMLILISIATAFYFYPLMPDKMASHWNAQGMVDGYMYKMWALFMIPFMLVFFNLLFHFIPKIDPEKKNIEKFWKSYNLFIAVFNLFMVYLYFLTIIFNMGIVMNMTVALMPAFAVLFYFCGELTGKSERNYTIGIKFPWTLANDDVWNKTNKLGEKLFKIVAGFTLLGTFFSNYALWLMFVPLTFSIVYLFVYSYLEFKKLEK
jgi:uncharacterized membrane protein